VKRRDFLWRTGVGLGSAALPLTLPVPRPVPTPAQLAWQRSELALFLHFGVNTFTGREWGDGLEDPALFNPAAFDARQWARVAKAAGFKTLILTAKHHDGFCLWPTDTSSHSVRRSPWRGGTGDVVHEVAVACQIEGLGFGVYLSPWDRNAPSYGDSPRYNSFYRDQLTELLTRYGSLVEVWFDGANGEGPGGRRQRYDWPAVYDLVRRLQPGALIFSDAGPDIRWIGNERGVAGDPNWCTVDPEVVPYPGATGPAVDAMLQHGDPAGTVWRPGEADVSIRPGWFWRPEEDASVKSPRELLEHYATSVGRNANLLLNVPPTREGLLHPADVASLSGFGELRRQWFEEDLAAGITWRRVAPDSYTADLPRPVTADTVLLREEIGRGQLVSGHRVEMRVGDGWTTVATGTTIGRSRLHRIEPLPASALRIRVESLDPPSLLPPRLYRAP
jgi:alpha-L-fucosidase